MSSLQADIRRIKYRINYITDFLNLVEKILDIDPDAAKYLLTKAGCIHNYHKDLGVVMVWRSTPQGHDYWSNIHKQLR